MQTKFIFFFRNVLCLCVIAFGVSAVAFAQGPADDSNGDTIPVLLKTEPTIVYGNICPGETFWFYGQSYTQPGVYQYTTTSALGGDSIIELHLSYATLPSVSLGNDKVLCSSDEFPIRLAPNATNAQGALYAWSTGETTSGIDVHQAGVYSVTVTSMSGCIGTAEVEVRVMDDVTLDVNQLDDFCDDGVATLEAVTNAPNINWSTGESTREIQVRAYGRYHVRVFDGPCQLAKDIDVERCEFNLYFPNCISASHDDGRNDYFFMSDPSVVSSWEIWIYDRWGVLVYHSTDPYFQWDGKINGKFATNQTFYWRAYAKPKTEDKKYEFHGGLLVL